MTASTSFPTRIKGQLPDGTRVAHKTGTSATTDGVTAATNDAGLITMPDGSHVALAIFMKDASAASAANDAIIARLARAAYDCWSRAPRLSTRTTSPNTAAAAMLASFLPARRAARVDPLVALRHE